MVVVCVHPTASELLETRTHFPLLRGSYVRTYRDYTQRVERMQLAPTGKPGVPGVLLIVMNLVTTKHERGGGGGGRLRDFGFLPEPRGAFFLCEKMTQKKRLPGYISYYECNTRYVLINIQQRRVYGGVRTRYVRSKNNPAQELMRGRNNKL